MTTSARNFAEGTLRREPHVIWEARGGRGVWGYRAFDPAKVVNGEGGSGAHRLRVGGNSIRRTSKLFENQPENPQEQLRPAEPVSRFPPRELTAEAKKLPVGGTIYQD